MTRIFDILISGILIAILSPILILVMVILRLTGEGEIFYLQERVGKNGRAMYVYKFATMLKNSPSIGSGIYTAKGDPRILPVGHFLRKSKLNELPQLFNVFLGHMSLVGPRPLIKRTFEFYSEDAQKKISSIRPGITGIGSIVFRDEETLLQKSNYDSLEEFYKEVIAPFKEELELWYLEKRNVFTYFALLFLTAWVVIFPSSRLQFKVFPSLPKALSNSN